jgi:hypothetical protein
LTVVSAHAGPRLPRELVNRPGNGSPVTMAGWFAWCIVRPNSALPCRTLSLPPRETRVVTRAGASVPLVTRAAGPRRRQRGAIDTLPSGALRVRVYAGIDPLTRRRHDLIEVIPPGPHAAREAKKAHPAARPGGRATERTHAHERQPPPGPLARSPRCRAVDPPWVPVHGREAHPALVGRCPGRPRRRGTAGDVLRATAQAPPPLQRPAVHRAPHGRAA